MPDLDDIIGSIFIGVITLGIIFIILSLLYISKGLIIPVLAFLYFVGRYVSKKIGELEL